MADLPSDRVRQVRPFSVVGIDFCGPYLIKQTLRSKTKHKIYICVFVCFAVKEVHFETVNDLSTESFIACLRCFISRRGIPSKIYSDNATNFVGARHELRELRDLFMSQGCNIAVVKFCTNHKIEWLTIPPRSPHFGGLWEAAVKSAKYHMRRVIGMRCVTKDEFIILLLQIEACLNSRPLTAISNDPNDFTTLSPGHFLIGAPLMSLPEPSLLSFPSNHLSRYQTLQFILQQFWKRWHIEYLSELQHRYKWKDASTNLKIGTLVLLHEQHIPPMCWPLGRIVELHFGDDKQVRLVSVKTARSTLKRLVTKVSPLWVEKDED